MSTPTSPRTREQQFAFLRDAHDGPPNWRALCLSLARQAAGLPAVYPSARAAMEATPSTYRRTLAQAERGMVAYFADPTDGNPYDHIVTVAGWAQGPRTLDNLLVWSNDAARSGGVDLVRASFFPSRWGDPFAFATPWLNGYLLPGFGAGSAPEEPAKPDPNRPTLGANYAAAIEDVTRALRRHRKAGHLQLAARLERDLERMHRLYDRHRKEG